MDDLEKRLRTIFAEEMMKRSTSPAVHAELSTWTEREPMPGSTGEAAIAAMRRAFDAGMEWQQELSSHEF